MQGTMMTTTDDNHALMINLTSKANGAVILFATDEWFAVADNLLNDHPPTFDPDAFCSQGKVMDGWETRRKRTPGHDWCIIALGGISSRPHQCSNDGNGMMLDRIEFDTAYFTGNQTPRVSVEAMRVTRPVKQQSDNSDTEGNMDFLYNWIPGSVSRLARGGGIQGSAASASQTDAALTSCKLVGKEMIEVLPMVPLKPGYEESRHHTFHLSEMTKQNIERLGGVTHLKLNYFPDGGVARMKVYGCPFHPRDNAVIKVKKDESNFTISEEEMIPGRTVVNHDDASSSSSLVALPSTCAHPTPELSSESNGGVGLAQSNAHYGVSHNLLQPTLGINMGDGWETARHPNRPSIIERDVITGLQKTQLLDWAVLKLGLGGARNIDRIIVDTRHFKGNYPESVAIDGCYCVVDEEVIKAAPYNFHGDEKKEVPAMIKVEWFPLLKRTRMMANAEHEYTMTSLSSSSSSSSMLVNLDRAVTHVRVSVRPDGGLSRVRIYGTPLNALANDNISSKSKL
jgi:allantoicase